MTWARHPLFHLIDVVVLGGKSRQARRDTAVSGGVSIDDRWMRTGTAVVDEAHVQALVMQKFDRLVVVGPKAVMDAQLRELMRRRGVRMVTAMGTGRQKQRDGPPYYKAEFSLVAMLPYIMEGGPVQDWDEEAEDAVAEQEEQDSDDEDEEGSDEEEEEA